MADDNTYNSDAMNDTYDSEGSPNGHRDQYEEGEEGYYYEEGEEGEEGGPPEGDYEESEDEYVEPEETLEDKLRALEHFQFARPMDLDDDATGALAFKSKCEQLELKFPIQSIVTKLTPDVEVLKLNHCGLGDKGIQALAEAIKINSRIQSLSVVDNWMTPVGARYLFEALHTNKNIKTLDVSENRLGVQKSDPRDKKLLSAGTLVGQLLQKNNTIDTLILRANKISDKDIEPIAEVLIENTNTTLQSLDFSYNEIGACGGSWIAKIIHHNTELKELNLEWNQLMTMGSYAVLKEGLKNNNTIRSFNIAWNGVDDEGGQVLGSILENSVIEEVNASHNRIGKIGAEGIANGLRSNSDLRKLLLDDNPLKDEGCAVIIQAVREANTSLTEVGLQSTGAGKLATDEYRQLKEVSSKDGIEVNVPKSLFAPAEW